MNPSPGRDFEAMDPLEWLARLADHVPDPTPADIAPTSMRTTPTALRGERPDEETGRHADDPEPTTRRRCSPGWARLIAKVFQVDPPEKPPPDIREVVRVPVDEEGRQIEVQPA